MCRSHIAALRKEMSATLSPIARRFCQFWVEEDQRFSAHPPVFDKAEAQGIDAAAPGQVGRGFPRRHDGIGKPRPIHVQAQTQFLCQRTYGADIPCSIRQAIFRRICDRHCMWLGLMDIFADRSGDGAY